MILGTLFPLSLLWMNKSLIKLCLNKCSYSRLQTWGHKAYFIILISIFTIPKNKVLIQWALSEWMKKLDYFLVNLISRDVAYWPKMSCVAFEPWRQLWVLSCHLGSMRKSARPLRKPVNVSFSPFTSRLLRYLHKLYKSKNSQV